MILDLDSFADLAEEMIKRIPAQFVQGLGGGIQVLPDRIEDEEGFLILGECYFDEYLGHWIHIYYGSFVQILAEEPLEVWKDELWETLLHEIRHHLENLAGLQDLVLEEMAELEAWREAQSKK